MEVENLDPVSFEAYMDMTSLEFLIILLMICIVFSKEPPYVSVISHFLLEETALVKSLYGLVRITRSMGAEPSCPDYK